MLATPSIAQVDPVTHKQCVEARDYAGCVKAFTSPQTGIEDGLEGLRAAMKQVAARVRSGFSLRDSTLFFQPVTDQLALVSGKYPDSLAVRNASKGAELFDVVQSAWQARINSLVRGYAGMIIYNCEVTKRGVERFNLVAGTEAVRYSVRGGLFGLVLGCQESVGLGHEEMMLSYVATLLDSGAISPEEIAAKEKAERERAAQAAREQELCALGPWNRYLEENPSIRKWAAANPAAVEAAKTRFLKSTKNQVQCQPLN